MKFLILCYILLGCSSQAPKKKPIIYSQDNPEVTTTKPKSPSITAKELAAELGSNLVTELTFPKGSAKLTKEQRQELRKLHQRAQSQELESVQLLSWADKEYPVQGQKISKEQINLANSRAKEVRDYLKTLDQAVTVNEINMAQRNDEEASLMSTEEDQIKKSLAIQDGHQDKTSLVMVIMVPEKVK